MFTLSVKTDIERRGESLGTSDRAIVERLRNQAFELQRRFELAERTAILLDQMLQPESKVAEALDGTYEAHAYVWLRLQLFRILVVDLHACVLDSARGAGSVAAIVKNLKKSASPIDALRAYYADPTCLVAEVESSDLSKEEEKAECERAIQRSLAETLSSIDSQWAAIQRAEAGLLESISAKRIRWVRNKMVAHFEQSGSGLVALDADPPAGDGKLTWSEPSQFLETIRQFVYDVFLLVTSTSWGDDAAAIDKFYAEAFFERLRSGNSTMKNPPHG